jgi:hypothetical protein
MIRGTIVRIGGRTMRTGRTSQLATQDCTSSRRSTVMCALPRAIAVTTVYQRDSSSKRPRASVVFAARPPTRRSTTWRARYSRASRPMGGAFGAPGHRAHHVAGCTHASKLTLARQLPSHLPKDRGLTRDHSISRLASCFVGGYQLRFSRRLRFHVGRRPPQLRVAVIVVDIRHQQSTFCCRDSTT